MRTSKPGRREAGMSLISVMMSASLMSIVMAAMADMVKTSNAASKRLEIQNERQYLKDFFLKQVDCTQTLGAAPATCSGAITLKKSDGTALLNGIGEVNPANPKWYVKADCNSSDSKVHLRIKVAAVKPTKSPSSTDPKDFFVDHFGLAQDWNNSRTSLWGEQPVLCENHFSAPSWAGVPAGTLVGFCTKSGSTCTSYTAPAKANATCEPGFAVKALSSSTQTCMKL